MAERKPLYDDGKIRVEYLPADASEHVLFVGDRSLVLQRGVLEELTLTENINRFTEKFDASCFGAAEGIMNSYIEEKKDQMGFTKAIINTRNVYAMRDVAYQDLRVALLMARNTELQAAYFEALNDIGCNH